MKKQLGYSVSVGLMISSLAAQATMTPTYERGLKNVYFTSPNGVQEVCVIPSHYPEIKYKKKDQKKEEKLCSYSFYDTSASDQAEGKETVALMPKLNSTNPGVNIYEIPKGATAEQVISSKGELDGASKIGKYKNSTSCSYTPSLVGYYHVSRILGGIARVPIAVLRSMDIETHKDIAEIGVRQTKVGDLINTTWASLLSSLSSGLASTKKDLLMTDDGKQSYGAVIVNPKNEKSYGDLFTGGPDRAAAFRDKNEIFKLVKNQAPISSIAPSSWTQKSVQNLFAMRDASEFILLDHLLDQQDRFGNIAFQIKLAYMTQETKNSVTDTDLEAADQEDYDKDKKENTVVLDKAPLAIKSMILKDNDCGVSKTNVVKAAGLLKLVAHMNPKTYKKLIQFQRSIGANAAFFTKNLMFTATDYRELVANVNDAVQILSSNCASGKLKLDLDLETYLTTGAVKAASCDVP